MFLHREPKKLLLIIMDLVTKKNINHTFRNTSIKDEK